MAKLSRLEYEERLRQISLLVLDVDGVLTGGEICYIEREGEAKTFNVRDGSAMFIARLIGVQTAVITARTSAAVARRFDELPVDFVRQGEPDKLSACREIQESAGVADREVAYVGDDLIDLPLLEHAGLGIGVANAHDKLLEYVDWVTTRAGGEGAVREVVDDLVAARGLWETVLDDYRQRQGVRTVATAERGTS